MQNTTLPWLIGLTLLSPHVTSAQPTVGSAGIIATAHPAASQAGLTMLHHGGNAADAAAAAAFALAVVEPYSSGLGGGGFALVKMEGNPVFVDFRETAPIAANETMYLDERGIPNRELSKDGVLSVAVPGAVAGYLAIQQKYGQLKRREILEPAINLAQTGFAVTERYQRYAQKRLDLLRQDRELAQGRHLTTFDN